MRILAIMSIWEDERVRAGMARQLRDRQRLLDAGAARLGWKLGLGGDAPRRRLGTDGPLVGCLTDATRVAPGAEVAIGDWGVPVLEAEIAVRMGADVSQQADRATAAAAVDALAPAIELADLRGPQDDVEEILAGGLFHRSVLLGDWDSGRAGLVLDGVRLDLDGTQPYARDAPPTALLGDLAELVAHTARALGAFGEQLIAGDVVLTGAIVPPIPVNPGERVTARFGPLGAIEITLV
jgi:2-keto-4-pentenoate hydratase